MLEFFWYGCIHCYNLEPKIDTWLKTLPKDVEFRRVPAVFNDRWAHDAAIFYTFEALGLLDKLHRPFFDAIHRDRLRTDNDAGAERVAGEARRRSEEVRGHGEVLRRAEQDQARDPHDLGLQDRRHAGHGGRTAATPWAPSEGMLEIVNNLVAAVRKNKQ